MWQVQRLSGRSGEWVGVSVPSKRINDAQTTLEAFSRRDPNGSFKIKWLEPSVNAR